MMARLYSAPCEQRGNENRKNDHAHRNAGYRFLGIHLVCWGWRNTSWQGVIAPSCLADELIPVNDALVEKGLKLATVKNIDTRHINNATDVEKARDLKSSDMN